MVIDLGDEAIDLSDAQQIPYEHLFSFVHFDSCARQQEQSCHRFRMTKRLTHQSF